MIEWIYWLQDTWRAHCVGFFIVGVFSTALVYFLMGWWHGWVFKKAAAKAAQDAAWDEGFDTGYRAGHAAGMKEGKAIGRARDPKTGHFVKTAAR